MNRKALARRSFGIGVYALVAAIAIQFFLAGLGIFADARLFFWHTTVDAALIFFGSIALVVLGRFAGLDRGTFGVPGIIAGMVILQSLLLFPYHLDLQEPWRAISGLHVVNGVAIFAIALRLMDRLRQDQLLPTHGEVAPKAAEGLEPRPSSSGGSAGQP